MSLTKEFRFSLSNNQWLGEPDLRYQMQGRLVLVHLMCRDMAPISRESFHAVDNEAGNKHFILYRRRMSILINSRTTESPLIYHSIRLRQPVRRFANERQRPHNAERIESNWIMRRALGIPIRREMGGRLQRNGNAIYWNLFRFRSSGNQAEENHTEFILAVCRLSRCRHTNEAHKQ